MMAKREARASRAAMRSKSSGAVQELLSRLPCCYCRIVAFGAAGARGRDLGRVRSAWPVCLRPPHCRIFDTLAPGRSSPPVRAMLASVTGEPLRASLLAAALTWAVGIRAWRSCCWLCRSTIRFRAADGSVGRWCWAPISKRDQPLLEAGSPESLAPRRVPIGNLSNRGHRPFDGGSGRYAIR